MRNSKDKSIIKLLLIFIVYYCVSIYLPRLVPNFGKIVNMIIKDVIIIILSILIFYKDIRSDYGKFKRSKHKWLLVVWALGIIVAWHFISYFVQNHYPNLFNVSSDGNNSGVLEYYNISKLYAFFKIVIFTGIAETILFNLSFRKVFNNNLIFVVVSSLIYTYFNYLFSGVNFHYILNPLVIRFIPCVLYNIAYIRNNNNIVSLMGIIMIRNIVTFIAITIG